MEKEIKKFSLKKYFIVFLIVGLVVIASITVIIISDQSSLSENDQKTLSSLEKIDDHPLYVMTYYGDYGFEQYLESGMNVHVQSTDKNIYWACTCFAALNNASDMLFGRNFDWSYGPKLLLFSDSPYGYASVTMVDMGMLGFSNDEQVSQMSIESQRNLLISPHYPLDGMNEFGLTIGCMAVPQADCPIVPNKTTLNSCSIMRLALDYAKTIEEVINLWESYNIYFPPGPPLHYLIADAEGNSAIIEWVDGDMKVLRNDNLWQVSTNFVIYGSSEQEKALCSRYTTCQGVLSNHNGKLTLIEAMELLEDVSQTNPSYSTQWTAVYNMHMRDISIVMGRKYEDPIHNFTLP